MENAVPGLPPEYSGLASVVIGLLSSLLVAPLTAIAKKLGGTTGPTTVMISAGLSLIVGLVFTMYTLAVSGNLTASGILIAVIAFLKSNGDYLTRVNANAKANKEAPPIVVTDAYVPPTRKPIEDGVTPTTDADFGPTPAGIGPTPSMTAE